MNNKGNSSITGKNNTNKDIVQLINNNQNMDYFNSKSFEIELLLKNKPKSIKHISNY
jgi:hypothetical protein